MYVIIYKRLGMFTQSKDVNLILTPLNLNIKKKMYSQDLRTICLQRRIFRYH